MSGTWILKVMAAIAGAFASFTLAGGGEYGILVGSFAFILILATRTLSVVVLGVGFALLFFLNTAITGWIETADIDPRFVYPLVFIVGFLVGNIEEKLMGRYLG